MSLYRRSSRIDAAAREAAQWLARADAGEVRLDSEEFQHWLGADPNHREAWQALTTGWDAFDDARHAGLASGMLLELRRRKRRRHTRLLWSACAGAAAVAFAFFLASRPPHAPVSSSELASASKLLKPKQRTLEDGTRVELDDDARIEVRYDSGRRDVMLANGRAMFTVAPEASRPFSVSTGSLTVTAIGTSFSVSTETAGVDILVTEGRVVVERTPTEQRVTASAGDRVRAATTGDHPFRYESVSDDELRRLLAWRRPRLVLDGTPLDDAVRRFNQQNQLQLRISDARLSRLKLSGVFDAGDPEGFARLLSANYGVMAERRGDLIELRPAS